MDWKIKKHNCPRCKSSKTKPIQTAGIKIMGVGVIITAIPFVFVLIGIPFIWGGVKMIQYANANKNKYFCIDCKNRWLPGG